MRRGGDGVSACTRDKGDLQCMIHTQHRVQYSGKDGKQPNVDDNKQHLTITTEPVAVSLDPPFLFPL